MPLAPAAQPFAPSVLLIWRVSLGGCSATLGFARSHVGSSPYMNFSGLARFIERAPHRLRPHCQHVNGRA